MGYVPNLYPPPRWFNGRMFFEKSKEIIEIVDDRLNEIIKAVQTIDSYEDSEFAYKVGAKIAELIVEMQLVRHYIVRGVKAALLLGIDDDNYIDEIEGKIPGHLFAKFLNVLSKKLHVRCSGGAQYGYPNYTFSEKNGESFRASEPEGLDLMKKAVIERKNLLEILMQIGQEILYQVYLEEKEYELSYYIFPDLYEEEYMYELLIDKGIANSREEIIERYGDDPYELYDVFKPIFDKKQEEDDKFSYDDKFWEWKEKDRIYEYGV